jgi:hypothetical protein
MIVEIKLDLDKEDDLLFYNRMKIVDGTCNAMFQITHNKYIRQTIPSTITRHS